MLLNTPQQMIEGNVKEMALPSYLLMLFLELLIEKTGYAIRPDILKALNTSQEYAFRGITAEAERYRIARKIDDDTRMLVAAIPSVQHIQHATLGVCKFILTLVDEGLHPDPGDNAVLSALAIFTEAQEDGQFDWHYHEGCADATASALMSRCSIMGYYLPKTQSAKDVVNHFTKRVNDAEAAHKAKLRQDVNIKH